MALEHNGRPETAGNTQGYSHQGYRKIKYDPKRSHKILPERTGGRFVFCRTESAYADIYSAIDGLSRKGGR